MTPGGAKRSELDKRDYSFHRSFGSIATPLGLLEYNYDLGKTMPDQNADGLFQGCTGYTQAEIAGDEDSAIYKPFYTYKRTCDFEDHDYSQPCDIRNSAKVGQAYGVQRLDETTETEALTHRRGKFFNVEKVPNEDWFNTFRQALRIGKRPISVGTIWFPEWSLTGSSGILSSAFSFDGKWDTEGGHNYKICGEKTINGLPHLVAKTWQGPQFGDKGWCYFPRETFNKAFDVYGTIGITQPPYDPSQILTIRLTLYQFLLTFLNRWLGLKIYA